jgi:hypothetical protein
LSPDLKRGRIIVSLYVEGYFPETIEKLKIMDKGIDIVSTVFLRIKLIKSLVKKEVFSGI